MLRESVRRGTWSDKGCQEQWEEKLVDGGVSSSFCLWLLRQGPPLRGAPCRNSTMLKNGLFMGYLNSGCWTVVIKIYF